MKSHLTSGEMFSQKKWNVNADSSTYGVMKKKWKEMKIIRRKYQAEKRERNRRNQKSLSRKSKKIINQAHQRRKSKKTRPQPVEEAEMFTAIIGIIGLNTEINRNEMKWKAAKHRSHTKIEGSWRNQRNRRKSNDWSIMKIENIEAIAKNQKISIRHTLLVKETSSKNQAYIDENEIRKRRHQHRASSISS